ncbi:ubiquitin domain-containing 1-like protein, partial [Tanacetum coccineum]
PRTTRIRKPAAWSHTEAITLVQLNALREEFWDTAPHYGGKQEIWDALRAAAESEIQLAQAIVSSAGIIVQNPDMTLCYDERGAMYELPLYVLTVTRVQLNALHEVMRSSGMLLHIMAAKKGALKAAAESEIQLAQAIVSSAGIIVQNPDLTLCYDEKGAIYELPLYVLSETYFDILDESNRTANK